MIRYIRKRSGVPVWSPRRVRELAESVNGHLGHAVDWQVIDARSRIELGALRVSFSRTDHGPETLAVRIDEVGGPSFGFTSDTGPKWSISELGHGLDVVLAEATLAPGDEGRVQHLTAAQAGAQAAAAGAGRLLLTHLQPGTDAAAQLAAARAHFAGPVEVVATNASYDL